MSVQQSADATRIALIDALNLDLQRKANSLFEYVNEALPYVPRGDESLMSVFERLAPLDKDNAESLATAVRMLEGVPSPGCWDLGVADINYLNVRFVAKQVIAEMKESVGMLERHVEMAADFPKVKAILHSVLDDTRFQSEQVEQALEALEKK